jgi:hypothetical protein
MVKAANHVRRALRHGVERTVAQSHTAAFLTFGLVPVLCDCLLSDRERALGTEASRAQPFTCVGADFPTAPTGGVQSRGAG